MSILVEIEITRRRLLMAASAAAAVAGLPRRSSLAAPGTPSPLASTPSAADVDRFIALSRTLCGGGRFDPAVAGQLLGWLNDDPALQRGLAELLADPAAAGSSSLPATPPAGAGDAPATDAAAAAEAILLFWYVGYFGGDPIPGRSAAYGELVAWQAMYTRPIAQCKEFGGWSQPPNTEPVVLGL
jgi:hypothetical protein